MRIPQSKCTGCGVSKPCVRVADIGWICRECLDGGGGIPPVDETKPIPKGATCQEASTLSRKAYIPCGRLATAIVRHDRDRRSYYMCGPCADHNVRNRGGKLVTP